VSISLNTGVLSAHSEDNDGMLLASSSSSSSLSQHGEKNDVPAVPPVKEAECATKIQAIWRIYLASKRIMFMVTNVIVCQSIIRRRIAIKRHENALLTRETSALSIQKVYRGYRDMIDFLIIVGHFILAQLIVRKRIATWRLHALRQIRWTNIEDAATKIRAVYLGYAMKNEYDLKLLRHAWRERMPQQAIERGPTKR